MWDLCRRLVRQQQELQSGRLGDVAPTLLALLGLAVPPQMTGRNLLLPVAAAAPR